MHELAIAEQIVNVVMTQVEAHQVKHVSSVRIQVGDAMGIVTDSLTFSFEMIARFTPELDGAHLEIEKVPYLAKCRRCKQDFIVKQFILQCPICEQWEADIVSGTEFRVLDMETG